MRKEKCSPTYNVIMNINQKKGDSNTLLVTTYTYIHTNIPDKTTITHIVMSELWINILKFDTLNRPSLTCLIHASLRDAIDN